MARPRTYLGSDSLPEKDFNFSNKESPQQLCEPCKRYEVNAEVRTYCSDCGELLCSDCTKYHRRNKSSAEHKLLDFKDGIGNKTKLDYLSYITKCKKHPKEEIKYHCVDHDYLCCNVCAIIDHRQCRKIIAIAEDQSTETCMTLEDVKKNLSLLQDHAAQLLEHEHKQTTAVKKTEEEITSSLASLQIVVNDVFSAIEMDIKQKSAFARHQILNASEFQMENLRQLQQSFQTSEQKLAAVSQFGLKHHEYLVRKELQSEIKEQMNLLQAYHRSASAETVTLSGYERIPEELSRVLPRLLNVVRSRSTNPLPVFPNINCGPEKNVPVLKKKSPPKNYQKQSPNVYPYTQIYD